MIKLEELRKEVVETIRFIPRGMLTTFACYFISIVVPSAVFVMSVLVGSPLPRESYPNIMYGAVFGFFSWFFFIVIFDYKIVREEQKTGETRNS